MKYTSLIIGIILFSGVLFVLFMAAGEIGQEYQSNDYVVYQELSNTYVNNTELGTKDNGTLQRIQTKLDAAEFSLVSAAVGAIDSILQGAKLMKDSIQVTSKVADQIQKDSQGRIHPIVIVIIKSIVAVLLIIIVFIVFIKMKPET